MSPFHVAITYAWMFVALGLVLAVISPATSALSVILAFGTALIFVSFANLLK